MTGFNADWRLYLFRFLQIAIISFLNARRLWWPLWTCSISEQTEALKYSWMATWCSSGILKMLCYTQYKSNIKPIEDHELRWKGTVGTANTSERTLTGPYAAVAPSRCPVRTCRTARNILAHCLWHRWWSWGEAVVEDCRLLQGKDEQSAQNLEAVHVSLKAVIHLFNFSLTWLLLYFFLSLDRVLEICHQTHVGAVIGIHQLRQHREEPDRNALRCLKSRLQHMHTIPLTGAERCGVIYIWLNQASGFYFLQDTTAPL